MSGVWEDVTKRVKRLEGGLTLGGLVRLHCTALNVLLPISVMRPPVRPDALSSVNNYKKLILILNQNIYRLIV